AERPGQHAGEVDDPDVGQRVGVVGGGHVSLLVRGVGESGSAKECRCNEVVVVTADVAVRAPDSRTTLPGPATPARAPAPSGIRTWAARLPVSRRDRAAARSPDGAAAVTQFMVTGWFMPQKKPITARQPHSTAASPDSPRTRTAGAVTTGEAMRIARWEARRSTNGMAAREIK